MRYVREPDATTVASQITTRIRSFTRVTQVVGDYASLMMRWMSVGLTALTLGVVFKFHPPMNPDS